MHEYMHTGICHIELPVFEISTRFTAHVIVVLTERVYILVSVKWTLQPLH